MSVDNERTTIHKERLEGDYGLAMALSAHDYGWFAIVTASVYDEQVKTLHQSVVVIEDGGIGTYANRIAAAVEKERERAMMAMENIAALIERHVKDARIKSYLVAEGMA
jgi:hypothetical protein